MLRSSRRVRISKRYFILNTCFQFFFAFLRDLVAELPFILMHPKPEEEIPPPSPSNRVSKDAGNECPVDANLIQLDG